MKKNYTMYHVHSDLSNAFVSSGADSVTKYTDYFDRAVEEGMTAIAISEHGNVLSWVKKKQEAEKRGLKYIHANEVYVTKGIAYHKETKKPIVERDNYHFLLLAKNKEGVHELNELTSRSYEKDGHFYYNPRITLEELKQTSDNILFTTACLASPLWRLYKQSNYADTKEKRDVAKKELESLIEWLQANNHRGYLEIQYHGDKEQIAFNQYIYQLSKEIGMPLIAGTDTHSLNEEQAKALAIYQKAKKIHFDNESTFDLTFPSYDELVERFKQQNALPMDVVLEAIEETNRMADRVEPFTLDTTPKYPKLYDDPITIFKQKINEGYIKRGIMELSKEQQAVYKQRIHEEVKTYIKLDTIDYMLLQTHIIDWCHQNGIYQGYGRGSVNGSLVAYLLGITEMDSVKHKLNFFRFLNPDRISLPDIDIDFPPSRRQEVIDFLSSLEGIHFSEIVTFNTIADKGAIRDVGRALELPLDTVDSISKSITTVGGHTHIPPAYIEQYPELFYYVDLLKGTIASIGSHPSGFLVSPISLEDNISTIYTKESTHRVSALNMKELDGLNYVKLDILGLANMEVINQTCELAGIERLTPDIIDVTDENVWHSLTTSTLGVFQWESRSAYEYIKTLFHPQTLHQIKQETGSIDYMSLLSMGNGAIRPSGASYRTRLSNGEFNSNGHVALDKLLEPTRGFLIFQEQIMNFLTELCNHTGAEADSVRRGLSKKEGTEQFLPKIEKGFIAHMTSGDHAISTKEAKDLLQQFLQVISDASSYGFSINHSLPYSYIGYACAWLRYYYPLEFLTVLLNQNKKEDTANIYEYAKQQGITIQPISYGHSKATYSMDREKGVIYKGIASILYLNEAIAEELYRHARNYPVTHAVDLLVSLVEHTSINSRQLRILIQLNFFSTIAKKETLLCLLDAMNGEVDTARFPIMAPETITTMKKKRNGEEVPTVKIVKKPTKYTKGLVEATKEARKQWLYQLEEAIHTSPLPTISLGEQIRFEQDVLGYIETTYPNVSLNVYLITDIQAKYTPVLTLFQVATGLSFRYKVKKKDFYQGDGTPNLSLHDCIQLQATKEEEGWRQIDGKWERNPDKKELFITECVVLKPNGKDEESLSY